MCDGSITEPYFSLEALKGQRPTCLTAEAWQSKRIDKLQESWMEQRGHGLFDLIFVQKGIFLGQVLALGEETSWSSQLWESQMGKVRKTDTEALWREEKDSPTESEEKPSHL